MPKYLDQTGLQYVLSTLTGKYDNRYLGLHATADAANKVTSGLTIKVRDEEVRVFDGSSAMEIEVAQASHRHPASEVDYTNSGMSTAATVKDALDIIVKNLQVAAGQLSSNSQVMQDLKDELAQEKLDRAAADSALQAEIDLLEKYVEDRLDGEGNIFDILEQAKEALQEMVEDEAEARKNADDALQALIDGHEDRLDVIEGDEETEGSIAYAVKQESDRAIEKENSLDAAIKAEKERAEAAEKVLTDDLAAEVQRATKAEEDEAAAREAADNTLDGKITAEKERAEAAEKTLTDNLAAEVLRATGAEEGLQGSIDAVEGRLDIIEGDGEGSIKKAVADLVDGAPETLDTLNEIAAALRDNAGVLDAIEEAFDVKLAGEKEAREAADKKLTEDLAQEVQDRTNADTVLDGKISANYTTLDGKIDGINNALDQRLDVIESKVTADDMTLAEVAQALKDNDDAIKQEVKDRQAADKEIQDQIDVIDGAADVEGSFRKAIADQAALQLAKDQAQDGRMDDIEEAIGEAKDGETPGTGLHGKIETLVEAEAAARESADNALDARLDVVEELIGDGEGSTTLKDLNQRLTSVEAEQLVQNKGIADNAAAIAAIVALETSDIDAAFAAAGL